MNTSDLIKRIATAHPKLFQRDADRVVAAVLGEIYAALKRGDRVVLQGFGTFTTRWHKPRVLYDPNLGVKRIIPGKWIVHFAPGKHSREAINHE